MQFAVDFLLSEMLFFVTINEQLSFAPSELRRVKRTTKKMIKKLAYLYRAWRYRWRVDPVEIRYLLSTLQPGDVAVDIGCHKGGYLYWMQRRVGRTGHCYAFEPQPKLFAYLQGIKKLFAFGHVTLENKGLSSVQGELELHIPVSASGSSPGATLNTVKGADYTRYLVDITSLDVYFYEAGINPALLKIDVEGHELEVLRGGNKLLSSCKPKILMECEQRHLREGESVYEVFRYLTDLGYKGSFIHKGEIRPLAEFDPIVHQRSGEGRFWEAPGYVNNFIFE